MIVSRNLVVAAFLSVSVRVSVDAQPALPSIGVERLAGLAQVWGFLKYYHPGVAQGTIDWDSALVAAIPRVKGARTPSGYNEIIRSLIAAAGAVPDCPRCRPASDYPDSLKKNLDFRWLAEDPLFARTTFQRLQHVRDNRAQGENRYVAVNITQTRSLNAAPTFLGEKPYTEMVYPNEEYRLLALFRFWNQVQYFAPNKYLNGSDWATILPEFIPKFVAAADSLQYNLAVLELTARVNDGHVSTSSPILTAALGAFSGQEIAKYVDNQLVIIRSFADSPEGSGFLAGDVVTAIDGIPVERRRAELLRYVPAANPQTVTRGIISLLFRHPRDSLSLTIRRGDRTLSRAFVPRSTATQTSRSGLSEAVRLLPGNVGVVDMSRLAAEQADSAMAVLRNTTGIVFDIRRAPEGAGPRLAELLLPQRRRTGRYVNTSLEYPGMLTYWADPNFAGPVGKNPNSYRGRIAIVVDEHTQSSAEGTAGALRAADNAKLIGTGTAGASGNVARITIPGGIRTLFTGMGVVNADGSQFQRIGLPIDIVVRPTLDGIRSGRDEAMERAIAYVISGK